MSHAVIYQSIEGSVQRIHIE